MFYLEIFKQNRKPYNIAIINYYLFAVFVLTYFCSTLTGLSC